MTDLIVDFPHQRNHHAVEFADTLQVRIVKRHEDARHELSGIPLLPPTTTTTTKTTDMTDLIVDFPHQRNHHAVEFADTLQVRIVKRHEDARHEIWYTSAEYDLMKLAMKRDVLNIRATTSSNDAAFASSGDDAAAAEEDNGFWIGIAHLLSPASMFEVVACRARCKRAVLAEQARQDQDPSARLRWEAIALASLAETRKAVLRARKLGKLHHDSI